MSDFDNLSDDQFADALLDMNLSTEDQDILINERLGGAKPEKVGEWGPIDAPMDPDLVGPAKQSIPEAWSEYADTSTQHKVAKGAYDMARFYPNAAKGFGEGVAGMAHMLAPWNWGETLGAVADLAGEGLSLASKGSEKLHESLYGIGPEEDIPAQTPILDMAADKMVRYAKSPLETVADDPFATTQDISLGGFGLRALKGGVKRSLPVKAFGENTKINKVLNKLGQKTDDLTQAAEQMDIGTIGIEHAGKLLKMMDLTAKMKKGVKVPTSAMVDFVKDRFSSIDPDQGYGWMSDDAKLTLAEPNYLGQSHATLTEAVRKDISKFMLKNRVYSPEDVVRWKDNSMADTAAMIEKNMFDDTIVHGAPEQISVPLGPNILWEMAGAYEKVIDGGKVVEIPLADAKLLKKFQGIIEARPGLDALGRKNKAKMYTQIDDTLRKSNVTVNPYKSTEIKTGGTITGGRNPSGDVQQPVSPITPEKKLTGRGNVEYRTPGQAEVPVEAPYPLGGVPEAAPSVTLNPFKSDKVPTGEGRKVEYRTPTGKSSMDYSGPTHQRVDLDPGKEFRTPGQETGSTRKTSVKENKHTSGVTATLEQWQEIKQAYDASPLNPASKKFTDMGVDDAIMVNSRASIQKAIENKIGKKANGNIDLMTKKKFIDHNKSTQVASLLKDSFSLMKETLGRTQANLSWVDRWMASSLLSGGVVGGGLYAAGGNVWASGAAMAATWVAHSKLKDPKFRLYVADALEHKYTPKGVKRLMTEPNPGNHARLASVFKTAEKFYDVVEKPAKNVARRTRDETVQTAVKTTAFTEREKRISERKRRVEAKRKELSAR